MPSVRVRRNTATIAQLVPVEHLQDLSTSSNGNPTQREVIPAAGNRLESSVELNDANGTDGRSAVQDAVAVQLAPPITVAAGNKEDGNQTETLPSATTSSDYATKSTVQAAESATLKTSTIAPPAAAAGVRKRARSRTIQAIFPLPTTTTTETISTPQQLPGNTWPPGNLHTAQNTIYEEPALGPTPPSSPLGRKRPTSSDTDLRRSLSQERTHRATTLARARGISISSTSGSAPIGIRLPARDQSQVDEAVSAGSPSIARRRSGEGHGQVEGGYGRSRSASVAGGVMAGSRLSGERERRDSVVVSSSSKAEDGPAATAIATGIAAAAGHRARAKTVAGPPTTTRGRAGSVGLMSYFGLGDGMEAKMQSWEDSRRDLMEKGLPPVAVLTPPQETSEEATLAEEDDGEGHDDEVVEHLDVIDPQIAAVSHLQNMANSIMIPYFPELYSRKPMLDLPTSTSSRPSAGQSADAGVNNAGLRHRKPTLASQKLPDSTVESVSTTDKPSIKPDDQVSDATSSEEEDALDEHVKDVLHKSKKEWLKRSMKGVWAFLKTPMGIITGIYGFMVVFWGAALVLFLLGWIPTSSKNTKDVWVVTGVGFIPWRVMDVYRIFRIWQLKRLSVKLRKKRGLPPIEDPDDLPDPKLDPTFVPVLSEYQQALLEYEQERFMASQTWYRPHATETHRAFSITWALWICSLIVGNSVFQCMLCGCMWGLNRHQRPAWTTGSLIPLSFGCGIASGILIWKGGERTKKKAQVEKKLRKALGMDGQEGQEGLLENAEKPAQTSAIDKEGRNSNDSDIGNGSAATSEGRDSQKLLPSTSDSPMNQKSELQHTENHEEFEMQEKRTLAGHD